MEINEQDATKRKYLTRSVAAIRDLSGAICSVSDYFVLFLALDATTISNLELRELSKELLRPGAAIYAYGGGIVNEFTINLTCSVMCPNLRGSAS